MVGDVSSKPLACRVLGHRWHFWREGRTIRWACERGCPQGGAREYASEDEARRYGRHFVRKPGPPNALLAALAGTVWRRGGRGEG